MVLKLNECQYPLSRILEVQYTLYHIVFSFSEYFKAYKVLFIYIHMKSTASVLCKNIVLLKKIYKQIKKFYLFIKKLLY